MQALAAAEQARVDVAHSRGQLQVTFDSIGDAVVTTDPHGRIQWMNPVAERLTWWTVDEAVGQPLSIVFFIADDATRTLKTDTVSVEQLRAVVTRVGPMRAAVRCYASSSLRRAMPA